jgi:hypothetical protein
MITKALYFPYIETPNDEWFTRVLLFWDAVGTIIPGGLENDSRYVTPRMRELRDEGLLEDVQPLFDFEKASAFRREFLGYLDHDAVQGRGTRPLSELPVTKVHLWKLGDLAQDLIARDLARHSTGPGWELWLEVEERTADLFMAYLAVVLGRLQEVPMDPVTNREQAMAALLGADTRTGGTLRRAREFRSGLLEGLLPAPEPSPPAQELANFKCDHRDELASFRACVNEELLRAAAFVEADAQEEQVEIALGRLRRERNQIVALMERRRWPRIVFGNIAGVAATTAAVVGPLVVGDAATAAFAAPSLIPAAYAALQGGPKAPDLEGKPMAYAALAHRRFGH